MAQCTACNQDQWQGYMTVLFVKHGIRQSVSIHAAVDRLITKFYVDILRDCFREEVKWAIAFLSKLSTPSTLDWHRVQHLPHPLLPDKDTDWLREGNK
jgi:hypothetical protein